ncbi:hypothetical protein TRFO_21485 [Tritrichomonas foetus]|uniref:Uncharacterized protein n=1 Tax=Tritrichomonas foetus TaxID=1144522 RepID=A0A1J4KID7_9EUKA|nr:hypothetical protein TRFO_21485 [Tritrichomonas foetus]|eukprot:OHT09596.1 hypothetical protein TRFO_21485 [Tritrichomonas foetus]
MSGGSFYVTKGFASIAYDDSLARLVYIEQLPMIAECLTFDHFRAELETVLKSIAQFSNMVTKFTEVLPSILEELSKNEQNKSSAISIVYMAGDKFCISSEEKSRNLFLNAAEEYLTKLNDIEFEYNNFLKPQLLTQISDNTLSGKFSLWRLARLTVLSNDYSKYEDLIFKIFAGNDISISNASEALPIMHPNLARKYLVKALMSPSDQTRINAIKAIEAYDIDTNDQFIAMAFENENSTNVLLRISKLPAKLISENMLRKLISHEDTSKYASNVALSSPYFQNMLSVLKEKGGVGCEINLLDFDLVKKCEPIPFDFLSMLVRESKEIMKDSTIDKILTLDEGQVMVKLLFPRMNEKGNWRSRFNAIKIGRKILERAKEGRQELDQTDIMNFAGFVVAMGLDHVYAVREATFKLINLFPPKDAHFIIESYISIVSTTDDFQKQILKEFLMIARDVIATNYDRKKIEEVMKKIDMDYPNYFDGK